MFRGYPQVLAGLARVAASARHGTGYRADVRANIARIRHTEIHPVGLPRTARRGDDARAQQDRQLPGLMLYGLELLVDGEQKFKRDTGILELNRKSCTAFEISPARALGHDETRVGRVEDHLDGCEFSAVHAKRVEHLELAQSSEHIDGHIARAAAGGGRGRDWNNHPLAVGFRWCGGIARVRLRIHPHPGNVEKEILKPGRCCGEVRDEGDLDVGGSR